MTARTEIYIDGNWIKGASTIENRSPSDTSDLIGHYAQADASHLEVALAAAQRAQPQWWAAGIQKRHDVLVAIGTELMARAEEIGRLLSRSLVIVLHRRQARPAHCRSPAPARRSGRKCAPRHRD